MNARVLAGGLAVAVAGCQLLSGGADLSVSVGAGATGGVGAAGSGGTGAMSGGTGGVGGGDGGTGLVGAAGCELAWSSPSVEDDPPGMTENQTVAGIVPDFDQGTVAAINLFNTSVGSVVPALWRVIGGVATTPLPIDGPNGFSSVAGIARLGDRLIVIGVAAADGGNLIRAYGADYGAVWTHQLFLGGITTNVELTAIASDGASKLYIAGRTTETSSQLSWEGAPTVAGGASFTDGDSFILEVPADGNSAQLRMLINAGNSAIGGMEASADRVVAFGAISPPMVGTVGATHFNGSDEDLVVDNSQPALIINDQAGFVLSFFDASATAPWFVVADAAGVDEATAAHILPSGETVAAFQLESNATIKSYASGDMQVDMNVPAEPRLLLSTLAQNGTPTELFRLSEAGRDVVVRGIVDDPCATNALLLLGNYEAQAVTTFALPATQSQRLAFAARWLFGADNVLDSTVLDGVNLASNPRQFLLASPLAVAQESNSPASGDDYDAMVVGLSTTVEP